MAAVERDAAGRSPRAWPIGAAYLRDSAPGSLIGERRFVNQLKAVLFQMQTERFYVPFEHIYFENVSGTDMKARHEFMSLLEQAEAGAFSAIAAYISSRLFRNIEGDRRQASTSPQRGKALLDGPPADGRARSPSVGDGTAIRSLMSCTAGRPAGSSHWPRSKPRAAACQQAPFRMDTA